jgi:hypothetical protein
MTCAGDHNEAVALHAADRLRDRGAGVAEALRDPSAQRNDVLLLQFEDRAEIHLRGVNEIGQRSLLRKLRTYASTITFENGG